MQTRGTVATDAVIEVRGLIKRYGDITAVDGIDFAVSRGEVFGLLGPNGAGKTTTVEILEGLRPPDGGQALVLGVDVATGADSLKPRIGISLQTAALYPKLTVVEVIDLFRSFYATSLPTGWSTCWSSASAGMRGPRTCPAGNDSVSRSRSRWSTTRS